MATLKDELTALVKRPLSLGDSGAAYARSEKIKADVASECYVLQQALYRAANRGERSLTYVLTDFNPWEGYLPALRRGVVAWAKGQGIYRKGHYNPRSGEFALTCAGW